MAEVINSDKIQTYIGKYMLTLISFQSKEHFLLVVIPVILQTIWGVTCFSSPKELGSCGDKYYQDNARSQNRCIWFESKSEII